MEDKTIKWLDDRFAKLLGYSYGGFLLLVIASLLYPTGVRIRQEALTSGVTAIAAVILGVGFYAFHRSLVIPTHHCLSCLFWRVMDIQCWYNPWKLRKACDSFIPTRWLGSLGRRVDLEGVNIGCRISAYSLLRHGKTFKHFEKQWDLMHAEVGLLLFTAEGLFITAILMKYGSPEKQLPFKPGSLMWLALGLAAALIIAAFPLHRNECQVFKANWHAVVSELIDAGFLFDAKKDPT